MKRISVHKKCIFLILMVASLFMLAGCNDTKERENKIPQSIEECNSKDITIGTIKGYVFDETIKQNIPEAKISYYIDRESAYKALAIGEIQAFVDDEPVIRARLRNADDIKLLNERLEDSDYAFVFPKNADGEKLSGEFSEYIKKLKEDGSLEQIDEKWFGTATDNKRSDDASELPATNGKLTIAYEGDNIPFVYNSAGRPVGYEVDLAIGFCREYGYGLEFVENSFSEVLDGVMEGEYSAGFGAVTVTEERAKRMIFSEPYYSGGISVCVSSQNNNNTDNSMKSEIERRFKRTFIDHDRYKLFLKGILITVIIFLLAAFLGTPLGILLYVGSERGNLVTRSIAKLVPKIIYCMPAIMIIMLIYYNYYTGMYYGGIIASVIGFTLVVAEGVYRVIRRNVSEIEEGLLEAKFRLEYMDKKEFFVALKEKRGERLVRDYREELINVLKLTSVVGYISVQDMTKVFETIRNESYELFVPLLATTLVYFILVWLLARLIRWRKKEVFQRMSAEEAAELIEAEIAEETEEDTEDSDEDKA